MGEQEQAKADSLVGGVLFEQQPCHCRFTSGLPLPSFKQRGVMAESGSAMLPQLLPGPYFIPLSPKQTLSSPCPFPYVSSLLSDLLLRSTVLLPLTFF